MKRTLPITTLRCPVPAECAPHWVDGGDFLQRTAMVVPCLACRDLPVAVLWTPKETT